MGMSFQSENNNLIKFILNSALLKGWSDSSFISNLSNNSRLSSLELYVTADCNQKCEYCYLNQHGDKLYPPEFRSPELILNNLEMLLSFATKRWTNLTNMDIFSGEIVGTDLFFKILDRILYYKKQGASYINIVVPSNFSFILSEIQTKKVQQYIDLFKENDLNLALSASIDGFLIEDKTRPLNSTLIRDEGFYNRVFEFVVKNGYCLHPMISPNSIEYWIDNYKWFLDKCEEYGIDCLDRVMTLEVRNSGWTPEKIEHYIRFLDFYTNYHFEHKYHNSPIHFAKSILGLANDLHGYVNFTLLDAIQFPSCSIAYQLTVRLGDLAIAPCHRTAYPELLYGKFVVQDNKIVDIEANNPAIATKILLANQRKVHHGCDTCWNVNSCIRGCFGAQYEYNQEIFMPLEDVCDLLKAKTKFLYEFYHSKGITTEIETLNKEDPSVNGSASIYLDTLSKLGQHIHY